MVIIAPPRAMFWSICPEIPNLNSMDLNRSGSMSAGFPSRFRRTQPVGERGERDDADRQEQADGFAALLPDEDAQHESAHPEDRQGRTDEVDSSRAGVRHVADEPASQSTMAMTTTSSRNATRYDRKVVMKPPINGPTAAAIAAAAPTRA